MMERFPGAKEIGAAYKLKVTHVFQKNIYYHPVLRENRGSNNIGLDYLNVGFTVVAPPGYLV